MRTLLAAVVCAVEVLAYVCVGVALGWKNNGGILLMMVLMGVLAATWKGIAGKKTDAKS